MGKSTEFGPEMTELKHADAAARGTRHANPCEVTISKFSGALCAVIFASIFVTRANQRPKNDGRTLV